MTRLVLERVVCKNCQKDVKRFRRYGHTISDRVYVALIYHTFLVEPFCSVECLLDHIQLNDHLSMLLVQNAGVFRRIKRDKLKRWIKHLKE